MKTVLLYGPLGEKFGKVWKLDIQSPQEAIRALLVNRPDMEGYLFDTNDDVGYKVIVGDVPLTLDELKVSTSKEIIKIVPVVTGSGGDVFNVIGGAALAVVGAAFGSSTLIGIGASMALGGVSNLLAPAPTTSPNSEGVERLEGFSFNGPVNTSAQGNAVPVGFGRMIVGSQVASAGLTADDFLDSNPSDSQLVPVP